MVSTMRKMFKEQENNMANYIVNHMLNFFYYVEFDFALFQFMRSFRTWRDYAPILAHMKRIRHGLFIKEDESALSVTTSSRCK